MIALAPRAAPFNRKRFIAFLSFLAVIAGFSLLRSGAPVRNRLGAASQPGPRLVEPPRTPFDSLQIGQPAEEVEGQLRGIGLPWALRRQGATGRFDARRITSDSIPELKTLVGIDVIYQGKRVGRYVEELVAVDEDHSALNVSFIPLDAKLIVQLVAPILTESDPVGQLQITMVEHARASLTGNDFGSSNDACGAPGSENLIDCDPDSYKIRRAYREERERAGANADKL